MCFCFSYVHFHYSCESQGLSKFTLHLTTSLSSSDDYTTLLIFLLKLLHGPWISMKYTQTSLFVTHYSKRKKTQKNSETHSGIKLQPICFADIFRANYILLFFFLLLLFHWSETIANYLYNIYITIVIKLS